MHKSPWEEEVEFILWVDWEQMWGNWRHWIGMREMEGEMPFQGTFRG